MLMYNCKVTKNKGLTVSPGYFGRPWRDTAKVKFINTVLEDGNTIAAEGWGSISGVLPENVAGFKEYGTKLSNGAAVSTSNRKGHILSQADAEKTNIIDYLNKWTPSFK